MSPPPARPGHFNYCSQLVLSRLNFSTLHRKLLDLMQQDICKQFQHTERLTILFIISIKHGSIPHVMSFMNFCIHELALFLKMQYRVSSLVTDLMFTFLHGRLNCLMTSPLLYDACHFDTFN